MKRLKIGTLIWHKKYGRGITSFVEGTDGVYFEKIGFIVVPRKELFTKGDKVYNTSWNGGRQPDTNVYTFYDAITHNPKNKSKFTMHSKDGRIIYAISMKHVETEYDICEEKHKRLLEELTKDEYHNCKCSITPKDRSSTDSVYKRFVDYVPETDSYAKFRKDCMDLERERMDTNKQAMISDLHLLTLESTAKEMLEAIKEIRDDTKEIRNGQ